MIPVVNSGILPVYFIPTAAFVVGTVVGSFLNVVVLRYGTRRDSLWERSACPDCGLRLRWWELVPLLSFVLLGGRCVRCKHRIRVQYPLVELAMGLGAIVAVIAWRMGERSVFLALVEFCMMGCLLVLGLIDWRTMLLPDRYIVVLAGVVLLGLLARGEVTALSTGGGALVGAGVLGGLWLITRGGGIGLGDVKLMVPVGAWFGVAGTIVLMYVAFTAGGLVAALLLTRGRHSMKSALPFGPFLTGAALLLLLFPGLTDWFLGAVLG